MFGKDDDQVFPFIVLLESAGSTPPPSNVLLLADGTDFLLSDGTNLLLAGS